MAASKDDLGKEQLQCLAFAHFAVQKYRSSEEDQHMQSFYDLFNSTNKPEISIIREYRKYLGGYFNFDRLYDNWVKTGGRGVDKDIKIVYDVAKTFYLSNNISKNFAQYKFLDQKDVVVRLIKNKSLERIIKALKLSFKFDILSSADIYIIKASSKEKILKEFDKEIIKKNDLYLINNFTKYNELLIKYWKSQELFGVSLKLPSSVGSNKNIKIVGAKDDILNKKMKQKLDPYTKFLSLLSDPSTNIKKLIDETIEIKRPFVLNKSAWDFSFIFNYKRLNLYPTDVEFVLQSWPKAQTVGGGAAGFNGHFEKNIPGYSTQWVGGTGIDTLEKFLFQYNEYNKIMAELASIRQKALNYALTDKTSTRPNINEPIDTEIEIKFSTPPKEAVYDKKTGDLKKFLLKKGEKNGVVYKTKVTGSLKVKNLQTLYSLALREIKNKSFNLGVTRNAKINKFIEEYEIKNGIVKNEILSRYKSAVVNLCQKKSASIDLDVDESMLNTYYEHSQISYFMLRGGLEYLKKKIFLTIFGVITKKGYNIVKESDLNTSKLANAIRVNAAKVLIKSIKSFDTVPHFYMS